MGKLEYSVIAPIKESDKGKVCLAKVEGYEFPVVVKELKHGNKAVFQSLCASESVYIPRIYRIEEDEGRLIIAEEYIEGEILSEYLASGKLTQEEWLDIAKQLCEALSTLHTSIPPVIHRDIKPSNIIINAKGQVKLIDFDSSRLYKEESENDTRLLGTERYAPPEQYGFSQTDARSDIYSLGVVFGLFPAFSSKARQKRWQRMVEKCTLFAPESRYQSVEAIEKEIDKIIRVGKKARMRIRIMGCILIPVLIAVLMLLFRNPIVPISEDIQPSPTPTEVPVTEAVQPSPTPTEVPVTEAVQPSPTPTDVPNETEQEVQTIPPALREIENDIPEYVALKEDIRDNNRYVMYCFKDRLTENGFWMQVGWFDNPGIHLIYIELHSVRDGRRFGLGNNNYEIIGNAVCIQEEYMQTLEDGYYSVVVNLYDAENGHEIGHEIYLYVAESDSWQNQEWWLQNTTLSYYGTADKVPQVIVKNDSYNKIDSLLYRDRTPVASSMYRILYDGKVLVFTEEFMCQYAEGDSVELFVVDTGGMYIPVRIDYLP